MEETLEKSIIRLKRKKALSFAVRNFKLYIDNELVGSIKNGESVEYSIEPGTHEIYVKVDWNKSKKTKVNLGSGEMIDFVCGALNNWLIALFMLGLWFLVTRNMMSNLVMVIIGCCLLISIVLSFVPSMNVFLNRVDKVLDKN